MIEKNDLTVEEFNCLTTDLVDGFPPAMSSYEGNALMNVFHPVTKELVSQFKLSKISGTNVWYMI